MANQRRMHKIAERIREVLASELLSMADERFHLVTITSVRVSSDLGEAKIYWTSSMSTNKEEIKSAFIKARGYFRSLLAKEIDTRRVPNLNFYYDDTLDATAEVDRLLNSIKNIEYNG
jgi:ribosome-binding factor A